jgi:hypothetical protein
LTCGLFRSNLLFAILLTPIDFYENVQAHARRSNSA